MMGPKNKLMAWNTDGTELAVRLGALYVQNCSELGELEGINVVDNVLLLEGDFGDITIQATSFSIEKLV